uniref:EOG090X04UV n=1 Tax=Lynceus sp. MCZ IZ 141354 TaxID=1930659 RepID=A0A9N6ZFX5_9CRUS|nr:EOG090X04UV [Lynceus sp. MCZ IZ 141354]
MADDIVTEGGRIIKMEVDYSSACDEKIPEAKKLASIGKLNEGLDMLLALEKQTRTGADAISTGRILVAIVQVCFEAKQYDLLNENLIALTKRRSQLKAAVTKMVQECCTYIDQLPTKELQLKIIDTLRTVTAGKIYVEVERARLTHRLAVMKEKEGDVTEAANIMQELQIETYGSMDKREKVELILEQMRLCLAKRDFIRTGIIAKKISVKFFEDKENQDLKLKYYKLMIELDQNEGSYLSICKHYRAIYSSCEGPEQLGILRKVVLYLLLSPYTNEQKDLTHRVLTEKPLEDLPVYRELIRQFTNAEIIHWQSLCARYENELRQIDVFAVGPGDKQWADFKCRVVEHNIRIISQYYTRITLKRMSQLLDLSIEESEEFLSGLVVGAVVQAKTDRLEGVVHFTHTKQDTNALLNHWSRNATELMDLVTRTNHLINREEMVHKHLTA